MTLTGAHYRQLTGQTAHKRWQERRLKMAPGNLQACQSGIPSAAAASVAAHGIRLDWLFGPAPTGPRLRSLLAHYHARCERSHRLEVYIRTQRVLHREARRLTCAAERALSRRPGTGAGPAPGAAAPVEGGGRRKAQRKPPPRRKLEERPARPTRTQRRQAKRQAKRPAERKAKRAKTEAAAAAPAAGRRKDRAGRLTVVIGWGSASTGYGSIISRRGRGPNQAMLRLLAREYAAEVHIIDERITSQVRAVVMSGGGAFQAGSLPWSPHSACYT